MLRRKAFGLHVEDDTQPVRLRLGTESASLSTSFVGLGYEMSSAATMGLLSVENKPYLQLIRNLGPRGVLRFGGIVADFTSYSAAGPAQSGAKNTVITRASLQQLRGFLDAIGWTAIWSVNFGAGTIEQAILEAKDVSAILGPRLGWIELGNEVENYSRGKQPLREPPYSYETYRAEYTRWRSAALAAMPGLRFAAPDSAASIEWVERMAADAHDDVQLLTTHYYRGDQKLGTRQQLLEPDPRLKMELERLRSASQESRVPWRMCETNSFFGGGRPGVSDTFTGALWTLDYMLLLAQYGCAGVNIETGMNQLGFISSYSPIEDDRVGHNTAGASYYGMLAFAAAARNASRVIPLEAEPAGDLLSTYALADERRVTSLVLINKSSDSAHSVSLESLRLGTPSLLRLRAPGLENKTGITFGGSEVDASGHWAAQPEQFRTGSVVVPPGEALVLRFAGSKHL